MIPVSRPSIGQEELAAIDKVFQTGWLGMGSLVKEFEDAVAKFLGAEHVVAVNSGTSALHLALDALGLGPGDEVLVPALTFVASIQAISATGAKPVFCDVELETMNIDISELKRKATKKTKAIMPIHYRGQACEMSAILSFAKEHNLRVVEDAAHAFGCLYEGKKIGGFGDITCFSFDPIKNITCGEGGAIATADKDLVEVMRRKRILGIDKDTWSRYRNERSWFYDVLTQGYRYHLSNINAAIGLEQLKKFEKFSRRRKELAKKYDQGLGNIAALSLLHTNHENVTMFTYIVRVLNNKRDDLMEHLKQQGIGTGIHYIPAHLFTYYKDYKVPLPNSQLLYDQILTLPLYYELTDEEVNLVIAQIKEFL